MGKLNHFFTFIGFIIFIAVLSGCSLFSTSKSIRGVVSYATNGNATDGYGSFYIILDDDTDVTNGYTARQIIPLDSAVTSVNYQIDTSDVPAGCYFLRGAWDFGNGNMDPDNPSVWEAGGWYGTNTADPPSFANIVDRDSIYNFSLIGFE